MIPRRSSLSLSFTVFLTKKGSWGANWLKVRRWLARAPQIRWQAEIKGSVFWPGLCYSASTRRDAGQKKFEPDKNTLGYHVMQWPTSLVCSLALWERERSSRQASYPRVLMCHNLNTRRPFLSSTSNSGQFLLTNYFISALKTLFQYSAKSPVHNSNRINLNTIKSSQYVTKHTLLNCDHYFLTKLLKYKYIYYPCEYYTQDDTCLSL